MGRYRIKKLADLAGVSVRTLHHYDQIGLLIPSQRSSKGYRIYETADLLRLQQILFFREIDMSLLDIKGVLDGRNFDQVEALKEHRKLLKRRSERLDRMMKTVDKTIRLLKEATVSINDEALYAGLSREEIERYKQEIKERYDPDLVAESNRRVAKMSKEQIAAIKLEGDDVTREIADLADRPPDDPEVQNLIARHHAWIEHFYTANRSVYTGLGQLYTEDAGFREYYDAFRPGLADFMKAAMAIYAEHALDMG